MRCLPNTTKQNVSYSEYKKTVALKQNAEISGEVNEECSLHFGILHLERMSRFRAFASNIYLCILDQSNNNKTQLSMMVVAMDAIKIKCKQSIRSNGRLVTSILLKLYKRWRGSANNRTLSDHVRLFILLHHQWSTNTAQFLSQMPNLLFISHNEKKHTKNAINESLL